MSSYELDQQCSSSEMGHYKLKHVLTFFFTNNSFQGDKKSCTACAPDGTPHAEILCVDISCKGAGGGETYGWGVGEG